MVERGADVNAVTDQNKSAAWFALRVRGEALVDLDKVENLINEELSLSSSRSASPLPEGRVYEGLGNSDLLGLVNNSSVGGASVDSPEGGVVSSSCSGKKAEVDKNVKNIVFDFDLKNFIEE